MKSTKRRSGFTLPEILVTVTIVAVLAAVVVPAVVQQVNKGSVPSAGSDMIGVRSAINAFATDTRHFPRLVSQLTANTLAGGDSDIAHVHFNADSVRFHGPYLSASGAGHTTPSGVYFRDSLNITNGLVCMSDSATTKNPAVTQIQAAALDSALDNGNGNGTGLVQWSDSTVTSLAKIGTLNVCLVSKG